MKLSLLPFLAALALPTAVNSAFIQMEEDPMTDNKSLMILEHSSNKVDNSIDIPEKGLFAISCIDMEGENIYRIIFTTPTYNSSDEQDLLVRFDKKEAEYWSMYGQTGGTGFELLRSKRDKFLNKFSIILSWLSNEKLIQNQ